MQLVFSKTKICPFFFVLFGPELSETPQVYTITFYIIRCMSEHKTNYTDVGSLSIPTSSIKVFRHLAMSVVSLVSSL